MTIRSHSPYAVVLAAISIVGGSIAFAQQPPASESPSTATPAPAAATPVPAVAAPAGKPVLSLSEIEALLQRQGIRVDELEVRDRVVEVEGRDESNREVEVIVDRRSGEILSRRFDD